MSVRIGWFWPTVTGTATAIAVAAGHIFLIAVLAGAFALFGAAMTCARALGMYEIPQDPPLTAPPVLVGVRELFTLGRAGREDLVLRLDDLESRGRRGRAPADLAAILAAPPEVFLRYLAVRVERIEGAQ